MTAKERRDSIDQLASIPDRAERLVLATGRYIGEGFDDARLDTLFLAMPVSWKGTLIQYSGRLHRRHPAKTEVRIYDYVDREVPMLLRMFEKRLPTYRAIGYARGEAPRRRRAGHPAVLAAGRLRAGRQGDRVRGRQRGEQRRHRPEHVARRRRLRGRGSDAQAVPAAGAGPGVPDQQAHLPHHHRARRTASPAAAESGGRRGRGANDDRGNSNAKGRTR